MTPRTFHNMLKGRLEREKVDKDERYLMHRELVVSVLSPHMKKSDREAAYKEIEREAKGLAPAKAKKQKEKDPLKFWEEIDKKARGTKEPPIPEG